MFHFLLILFDFLLTFLLPLGQLVWAQEEPNRHLLNPRRKRVEIRVFYLGAVPDSGDAQSHKIG
jgi:hypothetical protein